MRLRRVLALASAAKPLVEIVGANVVGAAAKFFRGVGEERRASVEFAAEGLGYDGPACIWTPEEPCA